MDRVRWQNSIAVSAGCGQRNTRNLIPRWFAPRLSPGKASSVNPQHSPLQRNRWRRSAAGQRLSRFGTNTAQRAVSGLKVQFQSANLTLWE